MGLDIAMTDTQGVNISQRSQQLINVQLDVYCGNGCFDLGVVLGNSVNGLWHKLQDEVEIDFIGLVARGVEAVLELTYVGVIDHAHDLQFAVLVALVLEDLLDGDGLAGFTDGSLKDDAEGAISDDSGGAITDGFLGDSGGGVGGGGGGRTVGGGRGSLRLVGGFCGRIGWW